MNKLKARYRLWNLIYGILGIVIGIIFIAIFIALLNSMGLRTMKITFVFGGGLAIVYGFACLKNCIATKVFNSINEYAPNPDEKKKAFEKAEYLLNNVSGKWNMHVDNGFYLYEGVRVDEVEFGELKNILWIYKEASSEKKGKVVLKKANGKIFNIFVPAEETMKCFEEITEMFPGAFSGHSADIENMYNDNREYMAAKVESRYI